MFRNAYVQTILHKTTNHLNDKHVANHSCYSVEHGHVKVVAVNDPFIEPHYAVSTPVSLSRLLPYELTPFDTVGIHVEVRFSAWSVQGSYLCRG